MFRFGGRIALNPVFASMIDTGHRLRIGIEIRFISLVLGSSQTACRVKLKVFVEPNALSPAHRSCTLIAYITYLVMRCT